MSIDGKSDSMPVFASVMRSTVAVKQDDMAALLQAEDKKSDADKNVVTAQEEPMAEVHESIHDNKYKEGENGRAETAGDVHTEVAAEGASEPVEEFNGPSESEIKEAVVPEKEVEVDGFRIDDDQTYREQEFSTLIEPSSSNSLPLCA